MAQGAAPTHSAWASSALEEMLLVPCKPPVLAPEDLHAGVAAVADNRRRRRPQGAPCHGRWEELVFPCPDASSSPSSSLTVLPPETNAMAAPRRPAPSQRCKAKPLPLLFHLTTGQVASNPAPSLWPCASAPHCRPDRALDPRHSIAPRTDLGEPRRCTCPATVFVLPFVCFRLALAYWVIFRSFPLHHKLNRNALAIAYVFDPSCQGSNPHGRAFILHFCNFASPENQLFPYFIYGRANLGHKHRSELSG